MPSRIVGIFLNKRAIRWEYGNMRGLLVTIYVVLRFWFNAFHVNWLCVITPLWAQLSAGFWICCILLNSFLAPLCGVARFELGLMPEWRYCKISLAKISDQERSVLFSLKVNSSFWIDLLNLLLLVLMTLQLSIKLWTKICPSIPKQVRRVIWESNDILLPPCIFLLKFPGQVLSEYMMWHQICFPAELH